MNILITGGMGYAGGRLAVHLREHFADSEILITSRNIRSKSPDWAKTFDVLKMDLLDDRSIDSCLKGRDIDVIIHLAALNEIDSMKDPDAAFRVNTMGTYRLLSCAKDHGVSKFIYFSTFHVYGDTSSSVITEDTPTRPYHPYAITHRAAEDIVTYFGHYHDMNTLILRLSNGYGYPMDRGVDRWTLVFNDLCRQAVVDEKLVLKSSGEQYRDFISLSNVNTAVQHFLSIPIEKWGDGLFNLGEGCVMSILDVATKVAKNYSLKYGAKEPIIERAVGKKGSAGSKFLFNIDKLLQTGFKPQDNMDVELAKTMELCEGFLK